MLLHWWPRQPWAQGIEAQKHALSIILEQSLDMCWHCLSFLVTLVHTYMLFLYTCLYHWFSLLDSVVHWPHSLSHSLAHHSAISLPLTHRPTDDRLQKVVKHSATCFVPFSTVPSLSLGCFSHFGARSTPAGPKIVLVPPRSMFIYICLSALEDHHAVYTRCIRRMQSLATTSGPARKVGVVSIFKMADLEQTLLNLSSSKIQ